MKKELRKSKNCFGEVKYYVYVNDYCEFASSSHDEALKMYDSVQESKEEVLKEHEGNYKKAF